MSDHHEHHPGGPAGGSLLERLRANDRLAADDPAAALEEIETILRQENPHQPLVWARRALLQNRLGRHDAVESARHCVELARRTGNLGAIVDLYDPFKDQLAQMGLDEHDRLHLAAAMTTLQRLDAAADLYEHVLLHDRGNRPALKGMIQLAEQHLHRERGAEDAVRIYDWLERHCPDHPFVEFAEQGRETAARRLARSH